MVLKMISTADIVPQNGEFVEVYPISDLHIGSKSFNEDRFQQTLNHIKESENRYVVLVGDLIDNGTRSSVTSPFESVMHPNEQRRYAADLLYLIRDRILAAVSGNHEQRTHKDAGINAMQLIMERLELEHLYQENIAFVKVDLGKRRGARGGTNKLAPKYCIAVTHGTGGGMTLGAGLNRAEPFAIALGVDLLITGHTHKPIASQTVRYEPKIESGTLTPRDVKILTSTGYLDWEGYPARKMLKPVSIAPNYAILDPTERSVTLVQQ